MQTILLAWKLVGQDRRSRIRWGGWGERRLRVGLLGVVIEDFMDRNRLRLALDHDQTNLARPVGAA